MAHPDPDTAGDGRHDEAQQSPRRTPPSTDAQEYHKTFRKTSETPSAVKSDGGPRVASLAVQGGVTPAPQCLSDGEAEDGGGGG